MRRGDLGCMLVVMGRAHRLVLFLSAAVAGVACAGLVGIADLPPMPDAGALDASLEVSCPDASPDAGFCALACPPPVFCDDFDQDDTFERWTGGLVAQQGSSAFTDAALSAPRAATLTTAAIDAGQAWSYVTTSLPAATVVRVDGDVRIAEPASHYGIFVLAFTPAPGYASAQINLDAAANGLDILQLVYTSTNVNENQYVTIGGSLASNTWFHVTLVVDLVARTLSLDIDGSNVVNGVSVSAAFEPSPWRLGAGVDYVSASDPGQAATFDNIIVR